MIDTKEEVSFLLLVVDGGEGRRTKCVIIKNKNNYRTICIIF
jgi:hypothetical protein